MLRTEDGLVVKRLNKDDQDGWQLISDNAVGFPPVAWHSGTEIIGEVAWAAITPR